MSTRTCLLASAIGRVERLESDCASAPRGAEGYSPEFQVAFPYRGMFVWHVGRDDIVSDPNQVLFVKGGEAFRVSDPRSSGYAELIITPSAGVLADLAAADGFAPEAHPLFLARSRRATPALQRRCAALVQCLSFDDVDAVGADEDLLFLLRNAMHTAARLPSAGERTRRLIGRTKEFLDSAFMRRIQLVDVAGAVGASPAYLTDVFQRFEGVSLQRYVMQLRLARALVELPHARDLTTLALNLGFSSHSHFTLVFRRAFDCTPIGIPADDDTRSGRGEVRARAR